MTHTLTIPNWLPPRANEWCYRHWNFKRGLTDDAEKFVRIYAAEQNIPRAKGRRRVSLLLTLGKGRRQADRDAYDKILLDVLVRTGLLLDDGDKGMAGRMEVEFERGTESATQITLEDVS